MTKQPQNEFPEWGIWTLYALTIAAGTGFSLGIEQTSFDVSTNSQGVLESPAAVLEKLNKLKSPLPDLTPDDE